MATKAFINQTKIDLMLDRKARQLVTDEQRRHLGNVALIGAALLERKVSFKWEFP